MTINRRSALALLGSGAALGLPGAAQAAPATGRFAHGIASGDPAADGAVIWTRVTTEAGAGDVPVTWQVSTSRDGKPVASGKATARTAADHTVKVELTRLRPGQDYWYRFAIEGGETSPVGQFRTLPTGSVDQLVLAVASCQLYSGGLFNAYADMAALPRLDAVLHLGDYIYEYGAEGYGVEIGSKLGRLPDPPHEIVSLADYRRRHAQVKADADMQAAHARAAFICVWDDHEVANDGWIGGAENHDPATEGDWGARKAAAMQAYFEWMPIRDPKPGRPWEAINRSFEFGNLATLAMVETRLLARSKQAEVKGGTPDPAEFASIMAERARPEREMLGAEQQRWLEGVLAKSVKSGKPWQLLGNQVVMARVAGPDLSGHADRIARLPEMYRDRLAAAVVGYKAGLPFNLDAWDGYPPARERLYAAFRRAGTRPIVLAGDSHAAWANDLYDDAGTLVASEFGATAITSPSYGSLLPGLGKPLAEANREVAYCDQDGKGYTLVTLTPGHATAEFVTVSTIYAKPFTRSVAARYRVAPGEARRPVEQA
ncbi:alkaline phosphatase D family protein [Sphingomonas sp. HF-S3]|uniref:Alkaline phosphatase D family protein n=1 Tax=Sphingomonas rustica TaxID=3103142 RepID=A0ABV0B5M2_9SPHN